MTRIREVFTKEHARKTTLVIADEYDLDTHIEMSKRIIKKGDIPYSHALNYRDVLLLSDSEDSKIFISTLTHMVESNHFDNAIVKGSEALTFRMKRAVEICSSRGVSVKFCK